MPNNILEMLRYRRPAWSDTEEEFIKRYIDTVPGVYADRYGNRILARNDARVIIACHTDTVHHDDGKQRIKQTGGVVRLAPSERKSNCLGADDTAGVYAALRLIEAGVPATFIFHRSEERGGNGSAWLARHYPDWLGEHDICLSLDRRGTGDIITSQAYGRSASDAFAASLARQVGMGHKAASGIFTDSANYAHLIPECSNISVGYRDEHSRDERLDLNYLERLIAALGGVDWHDLTVSRNPDEEDPYGLYGDEWDSYLTTAKNNSADDAEEEYIDTQENANV